MKPRDGSAGVNLPQGTHVTSDVARDNGDGSPCPKRDTGDTSLVEPQTKSAASPLEPQKIEQRSFEIITEELGERTFPPLHEPIVKRVIHTTADFSYADNLVFSHHAAEKGMETLRNGATIVTDTNMVLAGINKAALKELNCSAVCYMADPEVAQEAKQREVTRATVSMEKASRIEGSLIMAVGNAPTALMRLCDLMEEGVIKPDLIIAVPVGFVNVVESKEAILETEVPAIVARGCKGGSNVAAAIVNALMYSITRKG